MMSPQERDAKQAIGGRDFAAMVDIRVQSPGEYNEWGEWEPGAVVSETWRVVTTPLTGRQRDALPVGDRESEARHFYATMPLRVMRVDTGEYGPTEGDQLVYGDSVYRAIQVERWSGYWRAIAVRLEPGNAGVSTR